MKLKEQKISNKELKWSTKHINFISKIKQHIQEKHQQTFDYICKMRSRIANKLASLNYRQFTSFVRSQKSQHKYIVSKHLSGLKTF